MSEQKHTPGPWVARQIAGVGLPGQIGYAIDFNADQEQVVDFVYEEADAKLIAAAPDLLEVLSALECDVNTLIYCHEKRPENFYRAMDVAKRNAERARSAIAKAGGRS